MKDNFRSITDTRQQSQVRHHLYEIIAMTIAAVIGNCDGWDEIEDFCYCKEKWLREHMGMKLEHGVPSETTFARVWGQIDPEAFSDALHNGRTGFMREVISIDGKTVCGAEAKNAGRYTFKDALEHPQWYPEMTSYETVDKGHGRIEKRTYYLSSDLSGLNNAADRSGLAGFGMVRSHVSVGEVESSEIRYAITSLKSVEVFAHAWRKHWGIENGLHYCLDVSFNEDHFHIRKDHAPDNLAVIRHFALSALKQIPKPKRASIKRKREICAFDLDYLSSALDLILL